MEKPEFIIGDENRFDEFTSNLKKEDRIAIISHIADPDGILIEFVETHKIPLLKKIGWYLNLKNRDPYKPLPDWILKTLKFSRVKV